MTTSVYDKHSKHFDQVSAYVIIDNEGDQKGTMTVKYPKDGMGKLYLYLHLHGSEMVQVSVSGCGFNKLSVAVQKAADVYVKQNLGNDKLNVQDLDFLKALCYVNHDFSAWNKYGSYKFLQAL
ncbi:hypothetical protein Phab24_id067 [Acinetobacter phage Phab24]|nr:hypothetical protein Phab24_id067 [Acinetobacter phage Phab24]